MGRNLLKLGAVLGLTGVAVVLLARAEQREARRRFLERRVERTGRMKAWR